MKKLFNAFLALMLLAGLSACSSSSSAPSAENSKETEKTDTPVSTEENNNDMGYTFENPYFVVRFTEQEIDGQETLLGYTVENLSDQEVYVKYGAWKKPAEPADPERTAYVAFDRGEPDYDEPWAVSLWSSTAEEANKEDRLGSWIFKFTFNEDGGVIDIEDQGWTFGSVRDGDPVSGNTDKPQISGHAEYEFVCDNPDIIINRYKEPFEQDGLVIVTVDYTNNTNYIVRMLEPGKTGSYGITSKEPCSLGDLEVGDTIEMDFPVWTTENSDGKGGGAPVDVHAYLVRTK